MAQRERRAIVLARAVQLLLLTVLLLVLVACVVDPAVQIRIQNKTDQRLTVTVWGYEAGDLPPGAEITYVALYSREYLVIYLPALRSPMWPSTVVNISLKQKISKVPWYSGEQ